MALKQFIIMLVIIGGIAAIINFALPESVYKRIALIVLAIVFVIAAINFLWPMAGLH